MARDWGRYSACGMGEGAGEYAWYFVGGAGETARGGAGEAARDMGRAEEGRAEEGRGDTARRLEGPLEGGGTGDEVSRLSNDERFMDEKGLVCLRLPLWLGEPPAFLISRAVAAGLGEPAAA